MITIPNLITASGMISYLLFFCLSIVNIQNGAVLAFSLLAYSYLADNLDGYIARKMNKTSLFGMIADLVTDKCRELIFSILIIIKVPSLTWIMIPFIIWTVIKATLIIPAKISNEVEKGRGGGWKDDYYKPIYKWFMEFNYHARSIWLITVLMGWCVPYSMYAFMILLLCEIYVMTKTSMGVLKYDD